MSESEQEGQAQEEQEQEQQAGQPPSALTPEQEHMWGMLAHLLALAGFIVPFGNIVGPLVVWLIQKDKSAFVDRHGKESLNFQISIAIYSIVVIPIGIVLTTVCIGLVILIAWPVLIIVAVILAALKANKGEFYKYPLCIRFIK